jgi:hypothetical protein
MRLFNTFNNLKLLLLGSLFLMHSMVGAYEFKHFQYKPQNKSVKAMKSSGTLPPLYQTIYDYLNGKYQNIGDEQSGPLIWDRQFGGGESNFSGFTWQKPEANFRFGVDRQIAPDLFDENRYIVHDTFLIEIDAQTLIKNLQAEGTVSISATNIGAFAGLKFYRKFEYYHFASTYMEALTADYTKLFLTFTKFNPQNLLKLDEYHVLKRQDAFTVLVGGLVVSPSYYGFSGSLGILGSFTDESNLTIQSLGSEDSPRAGEFLRASFEKEYKASAAVNLSVQLDFFNLIQMELLKYELEYEYTKSHKVHYSFYEDEKNELKEGKKADDFLNLTRLKGSDLVTLKPNIVEEDFRSHENLKSKFNFLILGTMKKWGTEQVRVQKNNTIKVFYKHFNESTQIIQNWWSKLISLIAQKLFNFETNVKNQALWSTNYTLEYLSESERDDLLVDSEEKFSLEVNFNFYSMNLNKSFKKHAMKRMLNYANFSQATFDLLSNDQLKGSFRLNSQFKINKEALNHLINKDENKVFENFMNVCDSHNQNWLNPEKRSKLLNRIQVGKNICVKKLGNLYLDFKFSNSDNKLYNLDLFKKFLNKYMKNIEKWQDIIDLFGETNTFFSGSLTSTRLNGMNYTTFFKTGNFTGSGVIDDYIRNGGTTPLHHDS